MSRIPIRELRDNLTPDQVIDIIRKFGEEPVGDYPDYVLYNRIHKELNNNEPKLYYYKRNKMFKGYSRDGEFFDIFQLVIDMSALRGTEMSLREAIEFCDLDADQEIDTTGYVVKHQLEYLQELNKDEDDSDELVEYSKGVMDNYIFDINGLMSWISEGISIDTLREFGIKYSPVDNLIAIPYYTQDNKLVGVRGRFLNEDAKAKYMPVRHGGRFLTHPTGRILYGLNVNEEAITKQKMAIIFEGEKSVMKMNTYFGRNSTALAVSGRRFSKEHLKLLTDLGVRDLIVAFDRDYSNKEEIEEEIGKLKEMFSFVTNRMNVSLIIDFNLLLGHKDSPADQGKEIFDTLIEERVFI